MTVEKILNDFRDYLKDENKSENTTKTYLNNVKTFLDFLQLEPDDNFNKLHRINIAEFKAYLNNVKNQKAKTINNKLSSLAEFNKFLVKININDEIVINKKDYIKIQENYLAPDVASYEDIIAFRNRILNQENKRNKADRKTSAPSQEFHNFKTIRDYCLVSFLAFAGLRISECLDLRVADFQQTLPNNKLFLNTQKVIVRSGKGNKAREFIMLDEIVEPLKEYLKVRESDSPYLFVSRQGEKLDRTTINKLFNRYGGELTPHKLRHFLASWLLNEKGFTIPEVMYITGHSDPKTLMIYTHPSEQQLREKLRK